QPAHTSNRTAAIGSANRGWADSRVFERSTILFITRLGRCVSEEDTFSDNGIQFSECSIKNAFRCQSGIGKRRENQCSAQPQQHPALISDEGQHPSERTHVNPLEQRPFP